MSQSALESTTSTNRPAPKPRLTRADQSRINGAKSKGPITPDGKAKSSRNALKHGLTAEKHAVLDIENPAEYKVVCDAAVDEFRPHSLFALRFVEKLANLDWRIERFAMLETAYLNFKISEASGIPTPEINPLIQAAEGTDEIASLVRGWISAVGSMNALDLLRRYTGMLHHQFNTTFSNFQKLEARAIARTRDRNLDPAFLPPYQKPDVASAEESATAPPPSPKPAAAGTKRPREKSAPTTIDRPNRRRQPSKPPLNALESRCR